MARDLPDISRAAHEAGLTVLGGFHDNDQTIFLLGPDEPGMWERIKAAPEWAGPDPVDQWSERVITALANRFGGTALFPFGEPPFHPFIGWALKTGRIHSSPAGLLVHGTQGLFVSFRGALCLPGHVAVPAPQDPPCTTCAARPCLSACPVDALKGDHYDVAACKAHIATPAGQDCLSSGCRARRACPVQPDRLPDQSAYHMRVFLGG
jgi:hypothetical protein